MKDLYIDILKNVKGIISDAPSVSIREFFENVLSDIWSSLFPKLS